MRRIGRSSSFTPAMVDTLRHTSSGWAATGEAMLISIGRDMTRVSHATMRETRPASALCSIRYPEVARLDRERISEGHSRDERRDPV